MKSLGVLVLVLGAAAITGLRDRGRGGSRKIMMPRWGSRRIPHTETELIYGAGMTKAKDE